MAGGWSVRRKSSKVAPSTGEHQASAPADASRRRSRSWAPRPLRLLCSCGSSHKKPAAVGAAASAAQAEGPALTLLFLGCDAAGKTTLAAALKGKPVATPDPTNGFVNGTAERRHSPLKLMDVGGGPNIRGIWSDYYPSVHAAVFVIDAADSARFAEARGLLAQAATHEALRGKPLLVLANKQDHPQAVGPTEIAEVLRVHELEVGAAGACYVAGSCLASARPIADGSDLDHGLAWLLDKVQAEYTALDARVQEEVAEQEARARKRKEERQARLAAKRAAREKEEAEAAAREANAQASAGAGSASGGS